MEGAIPPFTVRCLGTDIHMRVSYDYKCEFCVVLGHVLITSHDCRCSFEAWDHYTPKDNVLTAEKNDQGCLYVGEIF